MTTGTIVPGLTMNQEPIEAWKEIDRDCRDNNDRLCRFRLRVYVVRRGTNYVLLPEANCGGVAVWNKLPKDTDGRPMHVPEIGDSTQLELMPSTTVIQRHSCGIEWAALPPDMKADPRKLPMMACKFWWDDRPRGAPNPVFGTIILFRSQLHKKLGKKLTDSLLAGVFGEPTGDMWSALMLQRPQLNPLALGAPTQSSLRAITQGPV